MFVWKRPINGNKTRCRPGYGSETRKDAIEAFCQPIKLAPSGLFLQSTDLDRYSATKTRQSTLAIGLSKALKETRISELRCRDHFVYSREHGDVRIAVSKIPKIPQCPDVAIIYQFWSIAAEKEKNVFSFCKLRSHVREWNQFWGKLLSAGNKHIETCLVIPLENCATKLTNRQRVSAC